MINPIIYFKIGDRGYTGIPDQKDNEYAHFEWINLNIHMKSRAFIRVFKAPGSTYSEFVEALQELSKAVEAYEDAVSKLDKPEHQIESDIMQDIIINATQAWADRQHK